MPTLRGRCHCGNVSVEFETVYALEALPIRADGCSFCRAHGVLATTDPAGRLLLTVRGGGALIRYRFGSRTADFLICGRCGVYVAALLPDGERSFATLNANVLDVRDRLGPPAPVSYDGESAQERVARRRAKWTPATLRIE